MLFYCEAKHEDLAIFDVHDLKDLEKLWNLKLDEEWDKNDQRSLIVLKGLKNVKYRGPREGFWYDLPDYFWNEFMFQSEESFRGRDWPDGPSLIIRLYGFYKGESEWDFIQYKVDLGDKR